MPPGTSDAESDDAVTPNRSEVTSTRTDGGGPPEGFWRVYVGGALSDGLRSTMVLQMYAFLAGCFLCACFVGTALFRVHLSTPVRVLLVAPAPIYFPVVTVVNSVILTVLTVCTRNLGRLEDALALVADGLTAPVLRVLPSGAISLTELKNRLLDSSKRLRRTELSHPSPDTESTATKSASIASRALLNLAIRTVILAIERRYKSALQFGGNTLSAATVKRMMSGELVSFLLAPFTSALTLYTILAVLETVVLTVAPFLVLFAAAQPTPMPVVTSPP